MRTNFFAFGLVFALEDEKINITKSAAQHSLVLCTMAPARFVETKLAQYEKKIVRKKNHIEYLELEALKRAIMPWNLGQIWIFFESREHSHGMAIEVTAELHRHRVGMPRRVP